MLDRTPDGLLKELNASDDALRPHLAGYDRDLLRVCGPAYGAASEFVEGDPENHWQEWLAIFLPQLVYNNPQVAIDTDAIEWPPERSVANQYALNAWAPLVDLRHDIEVCAADYAVRYAVGMVTPQVIEGYEDAEDPPMLPAFTRLSPHDFRVDSTVKDWRKARWKAHRLVLDIDDVIHAAEKDPSLRWNMKMLRSLEKQVGRDARDMRRFGGTAERKQLIVWEVWDRQMKLPGAGSQKDGYFGTVYTVLDAGQSSAARAPGDWVRKPRPYFGPRSGPYCVEGAMLLGDLAVPCSPLIAHTPQAVYLNRIARAIMRAVADYKRLAVTTDNALAEKIENGDDMTVFSADGIDVRAVISQLEIGGLTQQLLTAKEDARQTLDRNSGLHEAARGNITGVATATEVQAAQLSSSMRSGFHVEKYRGFVRQIFEKACFYFDVDEDVMIDVGNLPMLLRDKRGMPTRRARIRGGIPRGSGWSAADHERLGLRIDPFSMSHTDEQTKQLRFQFIQATLQTVAALPPQIAVAFDLPWFLREAEKASSVRDLQRLLDPDVFYAIQSQMLQLGQTVQPQRKPQGQPRFGWNSVTPVSPLGPGARSQAPEIKAAPNAWSSRGAPQQSQGAA